MTVVLPSARRYLPHVWLHRSGCRTWTTIHIRTDIRMKGIVTIWEECFCMWWQYVPLFYLFWDWSWDPSVMWKKGHTRICWRHYFHVAHPILWMDWIRPDSLAFHSYFDRCECGSSGHRYWKGSRLGRWRAGCWYSTCAIRCKSVLPTTRPFYIENPLISLSFKLSSIEGLSSYSVPRFWPKDSASLIGSIHIQLKPSFDRLGPHSTSEITYTNLDRVVENVDTLLREKISGLDELTIQVEGVQGLQ